MFKLSTLFVAVMAAGLLALVGCGGQAAGFNETLGLGRNQEVGLVGHGGVGVQHALGAVLPAVPAGGGVAARNASDLVEIPGSAALESAGGTLLGEHLALLSSAADMAWALYKFDGLVGRQPTAIEIQVALDAAHSPYSVGISNYSAGAWDFLAVGTEPLFHADLGAEVARLANEIGELYVVVVVNGGAGVTIDSLALESEIDDNPNDNLPGMADGLTVSEGLPDRIEIGWTSAAGATAYELWRQLDNADGGGQDGGSDDGADGHGDMVLLATLDGAATTYTDTDIVLSTEYKYQVRSISAAGPAGFSDDRSGYAGTPPVDDGGNGGGGKGLVVSEGLPDRIELSWDAVADATGYEVWRRLDSPGDDAFNLLATVDGATIGYSDIDVVLSTEYKYQVRAILADGPAPFGDDRSGYAGDPPPAPPV